MPFKKAKRSSLLLKTGQLTSYGSGAGVDDGAYQKGVAKSYTVLTAGQYAGTVNITLNGKTDTKSNACVLDNNTGLMWSRTIPASVGPSSNGTLPWTTNANGEGIFTYCAAANAAGLAGYSDWRVANLFELAGIMNQEAGSAGLTGSAAFPNFGLTASAFHTSTTLPGTTANSYTVATVNGNQSNAGKTLDRLFALVRGG
jgi:hypothetical protein